MLNLCELVRQCYNCHWKKDLCNQKGTNNEFHLLQMTDSGYFKGLKCTFIQKKIWMFLEFCDSIILTNTISQMDISLQAAGKQLRYSIVFSALANHIYMENCKSLCTLFHISVANCKWGSVCNVESRTLLVGVCKLRTGESLMYLRHNHLCN